MRTGALQGRNEKLQWDLPPTTVNPNVETCLPILFGIWCQLLCWARLSLVWVLGSWVPCRWGSLWGSMHLSPPALPGPGFRDHPLHPCCQTAPLSVAKGPSELCASRPLPHERAPKPLACHHPLETRGWVRPQSQTSPARRACSLNLASLCSPEPPLAQRTHAALCFATHQPGLTSAPSPQAFWSAAAPRSPCSLPGPCQSSALPPPPVGSTLYHSCPHIG